MLLNACFGNLKDAKTVVAQLRMWFYDYNPKAPHKGLKTLSPREFLEETKRVSKWIGFISNSTSNHRKKRP